MGHALVGDGRGEHRHRDVLAEDGRRRADGADVHEHPWTEPPPVERLDVVAKRVLVAGAAGEVAEGALVERLAGELLVVADVDGAVRGFHGVKLASCESGYRAAMSDLPTYPRGCRARSGGRHAGSTERLLELGPASGRVPARHARPRRAVDRDHRHRAGGGQSGGRGRQLLGRDRHRLPAHAVLPFVYYTVMHGRASGQTLGKKWLGIAVEEDSAGGSIGYGRAFGRYAIIFVFALHPSDPLGLPLAALGPEEPGAARQGRGQRRRQGLTSAVTRPVRESIRLMRRPSNSLT